METKKYRVSLALQLEVPADMSQEGIRAQFMALISNKYSTVKPTIEEVQEEEVTNVPGVNILLNKAAREYFEQAMRPENRQGNKYIHPNIKGPTVGVYKERHILLAFDNTTGDLWTEEFGLTEHKKAIEWCVRNYIA